MKILSVLTWLPIARPDVRRTRFLCLMKAAKVKNVDTTMAGGAARGATGGIIGNITE